MVEGVNVVPLGQFFALYEFEDPTTHQVMVHSTLLAVLERARERVGFPIRVTSGYRTVAHNRKVGGVPRSLHLVGAAADLVVATSRQRVELLAVLRQDARVLVVDEGDHMHVQVGGVEVPDVLVG